LSHSAQWKTCAIHAQCKISSIYQIADVLCHYSITSLAGA